MSRRAVLWSLALAIAGGLIGGAARGGVDIGLSNGDRVAGTISPQSEVETFRVRLPAEAKLSVAAKGKKSKDIRTAPAITFAILDATETDIAAATLRPRGKTGAKFTGVVASSGEYRIMVRGDAAGDYQLSVKWKGRAKYVAEDSLGPPESPPLMVPFAFERGSALSVFVKAGKGSSARPRAIDVVAGANVTLVPAEPDGSSTRHKVKKHVLDGEGAATLRIQNASGGAAGGVLCKLKVHSPKPAKNKHALTARDLGTGDGLAGYAVGKVLGPAGGEIGVGPFEPTAIALAMLSIPPGALTQPTACVVATASPIAAKDEGLAAAGPAVFFGPDGQQFGAPVTVTIPFDPSFFPNGTDDLVVYVRDRKGKVTAVPRDASFVIDVVNGTCTFATSGFSSYSVFGTAPPMSELHAVVDGIAYDVAVVPGSCDDKRDCANGGSDYGYVYLYADDVAPTASPPGGRVCTEFSIGIDLGEPPPQFPHEFDTMEASLMITQITYDASDQPVDTMSWHTFESPFTLTVTSFESGVITGSFSGEATPELPGGQVVSVSGSFSFSVQSQ